ncbi:Uma2 family endonuclease [Nonomuraea rubra]
MTALPDDGWLAAHAPPWRFMLLPSPRAAEGYTVEDWLALPVTGERIELIDGRYVVSPMPGYASAVAVGRLVGILDAARPGDYEVVAAGNLAVGGDGLIADAVVGCAKQMRGAVTLAPDAVACVAEVVGSGRRHDIKPPKYAAGGIPHFIRVELQGDGAPRAEVFDLAAQGYELVAEAKAGDTLTASVPFPITFDPAALTGLRR